MSRSDSGAINSRFYDALWSRTYLERPERFNTWPLISSLIRSGDQRLEVGAGLRPRLPVCGTHFIDRSTAAVVRLQEQGGRAQCGDVCALPFADGTFDLVCAFDVIEHVENSSLAFIEVSRVLKKGGTLVFSVPLHRNRWSEFDAFVGHMHRFDPPEVLALLAGNRLVLEKTAPYGMQPKSSWLLNCGLWFLRHQSSQAIFWYNQILMPLGLFFQKPLVFSAGMENTAYVDELVCVCRYQGPP